MHYMNYIYISYVIYVILSLHIHTHTHTHTVFKLLQNAFFSSVHRTFTKIGHHILGHNASPNKY